jgi:hypothetical protein
MVKAKRGQPDADSNDKTKSGNAGGDGASSFAWEFGSEEPDRQASGARQRGRIDNTRATGDKARHVQKPSPQTIDHARSDSGAKSAPGAPPSNGTFGAARANYVRDQLDHALDLWWSAGQVPPLGLLRDGLLLLEAGGTVPESQRTLLLRGALAYDRGIKTALRHQSDDERVALVLAESVVEWEAPVDPERLSEILAGNERIRSLLVEELERTRILMTGEARLRAEQALEHLPRPSSPGPDFTVIPATPPVVRRRPFRQILLILLLLAFVGFALWRQRQLLPDGMVAMPAATYALHTASQDGVVRSVRLEPFFIDRFEITNREYRACIEAGACLWPIRNHSLTRTEYLTNPVFGDYPVVNVTQGMASTYCAWKGKRLPSADEWQAAASVSPTTGQPFRYPWGQTFDAQRANSAITALGDTVAVGSFRPGGGSPAGAEDMAGNVAEWTSSIVEGSVVEGPEGKGYALVKGGSFLSQPDELFVGAALEMDVTEASVQVGFRCSQSRLLPAQGP